MELKNKVAIITGASKGIGKATALALAREGCHIAVSARSKKQLQEVAGEAAQFGVDTLAFTGDMSDEKDIKRFISEVWTTFARIDILVNNAGIGLFSPIADMSTDDWDRMFNLNMRGLSIATREAIPHLRKAGRAFVVNVSSLAGKNSFVGGGGYAATKHALMAFSRCLMLEERKNGINVLAICPGSVNTPFSAGRLADDDPKRQRILQAEDVAASILHALKQPPHAMVSEIDIRPANP